MRLEESECQEKIHVYQKKKCEAEPVTFFTAGTIQKFFRLSRLAICNDDQISEQLHEKYKWICMKYDQERDNLNKRQLAEQRWDIAW